MKFHTREYLTSPFPDTRHQTILFSHNILAERTPYGPYILTSRSNIDETIDICPAGNLTAFSRPGGKKLLKPEYF